MTIIDGSGGMSGRGEQRVVLITGTSSAKGIGLATSRALAARGHVVYATVRHPRGSAELAPVAGPGRIETRELDLLDREPMGSQSSDAARAYAAAALRDPSRSTELRRLLTTIETATRPAHDDDGAGGAGARRHGR